MRMSAPGLYRYFDGRDGLITALIVDALTDLAVRVEKARDEVPAADGGGRLLAVSQAYREWALSDKEGFTLVFGPTLAGCAHHTEGPDKAAALRALEGLRSLIREADEHGTRRRPALTGVPPVLREAFSDSALHGPDPATELAMAHVWASLHGFVSLEAYGNLEWHGAEARDAMFLGLVRLLTAALGLPDPVDGWPAGTPTP
jgi:AcrR family transcriptional regulator